MGQLGASIAPVPSHDNKDIKKSLCLGYQTAHLTVIPGFAPGIGNWTCTATRLGVTANTYRNPTGTG